MSRRGELRHVPWSIVHRYLTEISVRPLVACSRSATTTCSPQSLMDETSPPLTDVIQDPASPTSSTPLFIAATSTLGITQLLLGTPGPNLRILFCRCQYKNLKLRLFAYYVSLLLVSLKLTGSASEALSYCYHQSVISSH